MASIPYVNAIGSLMYLALNIRPNMVFPISPLAQFFVQSWFGALVWYKMPFVLSSSNTTYGHCPSHFNLCFLKVGHMQIGLATLILDGLSPIMYFLLVAVLFHGKV